MAAVWPAVRTGVIQPFADVPGGLGAGAAGKRKRALDPASAVLFRIGPASVPKTSITKGRLSVEAPALFPVRPARIGVSA